MSTGTYTGAVQQSLSVKVLDGGFVDFYCRTDEPDGPGRSYDILCSATGIQVLPPDKGTPQPCLELPGTETTPDAAGYLGWLTYEETMMYPDCRDTGVAPRIDYTSLLGTPYLPPTLGSQPATCAASDGGKKLSFKDLLGQPVTVALKGYGVIINIQWQRSGGP
jgi:hypothetical protein